MWCSNTASNIFQQHTVIFIDFPFLMGHRCFQACGNQLAFPFIVKHAFLSSWNLTIHSKNVAWLILASLYTDKNSSLISVFILPIFTRYFMPIRCSIFRLISIFDKNQQVQLLDIPHSLRNRGYTRSIDLKFRIHIDIGTWWTASDYVSVTTGYVQKVVWEPECIKYASFWLQGFIRSS